MVTLSFLGDLFASPKDEAESGDIYRTHKLVHFFGPQASQAHTLRVWNVLMLLTYSLFSLVRLFL